MVMNVLPADEPIGDSAPALAAARTDVWRMIYRGCLRLIGAWIERRRQRLALAILDDRMPDDSGITRSEAARESAKPFWRLV